MTISQAILVVMVCVTMIWAACYYNRRRKSAPLDYVQAKEIIERLSSNQNKLNNIEDLLTTSQLYDDEYAPDIKCTWSSADKQYGYTFDIGNTSNHFKEMAEDEREKLRSLLLSDIDALCDLRRYGVTQSVTQTEEKTAGECLSGESTAEPEKELTEFTNVEESTKWEKSDAPINGTSISYPDCWHTYT